jgi:hypothetical protein
MFRKAILKPFSLGMELRLVKKLLLTLFEKLLLSKDSMLGSHISDTPSSLSFDVHKADEKNLYDYQLVNTPAVFTLFDFKYVQKLCPSTLSPMW